MKYKLAIFHFRARDRFYFTKKPFQFKASRYRKVFFSHLIRFHLRHVLQSPFDNFPISLLFTVELNKDQEITNGFYPRANGSFLVAAKNKLLLS